MRIRKNTKLSSVLLATAGYSGDRPETYACLLNQSPWDVIPVSSPSDDTELSNLLDSSWFLPPSSSSSSPPQIQWKLKQSYETSPEPMDQSDYSDKKSKSVEPNSPLKTSGDDDQVTVTMPAPPKRGRPRGMGKKTSGSTATSTNPYEFYYYSGFGPRWGRKRNGSGDEKIVVKSLENNNSNSSDEEGDKTTAFGDGSSSLDGFDYMEEENGVESDDHEMIKKKKKDKLMMLKKKKKKGRKPVKERSLKSLM